MSTPWLQTGLCAVFVLISARPVFTQAPQPAPAQATPATPAERRFEYGVRFGPSFATLTSVEPFDPELVGSAFEPTLNYGGFFWIHLAGPWSFQPEIIFAAKGQRVHDKDAPPTTAPDGELKPPVADRVVLIRYLDFPLLVRLSKQTGEDTSLYLIGGPSIGLLRNAVIRQVGDAEKFVDIEDMVKGTNLSFIVGAGVQHKRWLADARLTRGIQNIAVNPDPVNVYANAFTVLIGVRF